MARTLTGAVGEIPETRQGVETYFLNKGDSKRTAKKLADDAVEHLTRLKLHIAETVIGHLR
jgi:hypothetical protein